VPASPLGCVSRTGRFAGVYFSSLFAFFFPTFFQKPLPDTLLCPSVLFVSNGGFGGVISGFFSLRVLLRFPPRLNFFFVLRLTFFYVPGVIRLTPNPVFSVVVPSFFTVQNPVASPSHVPTNVEFRRSRWQRGEHFPLSTIYPRPLGYFCGFFSLCFQGREVVTQF